MANLTTSASKSIMSAPKTYIYLDQLDGNFVRGSVRIRVLQKDVNPEGFVDMIFIDQKGTIINAKIINTNFERFAHTLKENLIYDVTRFSSPLAKKWNRPTRHQCVMFINSNTSVDQVREIAGFPTMRKPTYIDLAEVLQAVQRQDTTFLFDVIGVVVYVSTPLSFSSEKIKRVVGIENNTGAMVKIVLWNEFAADFEKLQIGEKSVLSFLSVAVNNFKGYDDECLASTKFTQIVKDSDHPCFLELQKGENYSELEAAVSLEDWREKNRKTLYEIVNDFDPEIADAVPYTCVAQIVGHGRLMKYLACKNCNSKCPDQSPSFFCNKCRMQTPTHYYCRMEITISDGTYSEVVTLFGNQLQTIFRTKLQKIVATSDDASKSGSFFEQMLRKTFVFELRTKLFTTSQSTSVSRIGEVVNTSDVLLSKQGKRKNTVLTDEHLQPKTPTKRITRGQSLPTNTKQTGPVVDVPEMSYDDGFDFADNAINLTTDGAVNEPATPIKPGTKRTPKNVKAAARQLAASKSKNITESRPTEDDNAGVEQEEDFDTPEE